MSELVEFEVNVIRKLTEKGWVKNSIIKEDVNRKNAFIEMIEWTPYGVEQMRILYRILTEVGVFEGVRNGDLYALRSLCRACISIHGADDSTLK